PLRRAGEEGRLRQRRRPGAAAGDDRVVPEEQRRQAAAERRPALGHGAGRGGRLVPAPRPLGHHEFRAGPAAGDRPRRQGLPSQRAARPRDRVVAKDPQVPVDGQGLSPGEPGSRSRRDLPEPGPRADAHQARTRGAGRHAHGAARRPERGARPPLQGRHRAADGGLRGADWGPHRLRPLRRDAGRLVDAERAALELRPGWPEKFMRSTVSRERPVSVRLDGEADHEGDTSYIAVADKDGNLVSFEPSLHSAFGTGVVMGETGIIFNCRGDYYSLVPGEANALEPGKRPRSTLQSTLVTKDCRPVLITGSP